MQILAVDDEEPVLRDLIWMLESSDAVDRVDPATSGSEALRRLNEDGVDYDGIFLDVRMPDLDGLELARVLRHFASPPVVVFVTAYQDAAVEAFEMGVLDYLVKPVGKRRLDQALSRLAEARDGGPQAEHEADDEIVPVDSLHGAKRLIARSSILYLRAQGDYVRAVTDGGRFLLRGRLSDLAERWEPLGFVRVHRQYAVNLRLAKEMRPHLNGTATLVFVGEREVPVARRRVGELRRRLHI
jgi:DNA-binding LytR/AlgR family response regulator